MWPSSCADDTACTATDPNAITIVTLLSLLPFAALFLIVQALVIRHLFPRLSAGHSALRDGEDHLLPSHAPAALRHAHAEHGAKSTYRQAAAWTFGTTVGLAATLGALILAEILEVVQPKAREVALLVTVPALLFLLVVLVPWMECRALVTGAGWSFQRTARGRLPRVAWGLQMLLFGGWLMAFWSVGNAVPAGATRSVADETGWVERLTRECLERIGVVGISLMALLAGFASVSSPWHIFGDASARRKRPITEADVNRKQVGLDATNEMLLTKRHRLQALERKLSDPHTVATRSSGGFVGKMIGSIRGASGDEAEIRALRMEISGLETMEANLASSVSLLRSQRVAAERASTASGRLLLAPSYIFACYCIYRLLATLLTTLRRATHASPFYPGSAAPASTFASSDPINRLLGLLARHWDPKLDQLAWARTISFALSGVMLLASGSSVVQTFHLFAKWTPGLLRHARANLALAVGQVAATYVVSASLLMRSNLPPEAREAVGGVLRGALSPGFVDGWFEGWFLVGSAVTGLGILLGRTVGGGEEWDEYGMEEMGAKRS